MEFKYYKQKLTEKEFIDFKKKYKLKLPESYRTIMLNFNGGEPEKEFFKGNSLYFLPIKYGRSTIEKTIELTKDVLPKGFFPFCDVYGQLYCINLNKDDYGKIYFYDETGEYKLVAESFDDFMNELSENPDY